MQFTIYISSTFILVCVGLFTLFHYLQKKCYKQKQSWFLQSIPLIPKYPHLVDSMDTLRTAPKMIHWVSRIEQMQLDVRSIVVTNIGWSSSTPISTQLEFVQCDVFALDKLTGKHILLNNVFIRGNSIAVLIVVKVKSVGRGIVREYVLICEQMRLSTGGRQKELCAGTIDKDGNVVSESLKEVKEETGFDIKNVHEMQSLGSIYSSTDVCGDETFLYSWTTTLSEREFEQKMCRVFGYASEWAEIKLHFVPMNLFIQTTLFEMKDATAECAIRRYCDGRLWSSYE